MLEHLNPRFRITGRRPPSADGLAALRARRQLSQQVIDLYEEIGEVDIKGPAPRYFRFWPPEEVLEIDSAYGVSEALHQAVPIGSDGGGKLIVIRDERVFSVSFGALAEQSLTLLANSLAEFLKNPDPLWAWADK